MVHIHKKVPVSNSFYDEEMNRGILDADPGSDSSFDFSSDSKPLVISELEEEVEKGKKAFGYRAEIDGLRTVAVIPVIFYHFDIFFIGGFAGVDVFFVISGYLITSIIISELTSGTFAFRTFWERRVRRLFPAMFNLFLWLFIIGRFTFQREDLVEMVKQIFFINVYTINFYFYSNTNSYWDSPESSIFLHCWSLAIEEQFYFIVPFCLFGIWKFSKEAKRLLAALTFFGLTCVFSLFLSISTSNQHTNFAYYLLPTRAFELSVGGFLGTLSLGGYWSPLVNSIPQRILRALSEITAWFGLLMIIYSYLVFDKELAYPSYHALIPCLGTAFFIGANTPCEALNGITLSTVYLLSLKPIVWIGSISYALYLWHWPIWVVGTYFSGTNIAIGSKFFFVIQSFAAAYFSTFYIESIPRNKKLFPSRLLWKTFSFFWLVILISTSVAFLPMTEPHKKLMYNNNHNSTDYPVVPVNPTNLKYGTNPFPDAYNFSEKSILESRPWENGGYYLETHAPVDAACVALVGTSHAAMYAHIFEELGKEFNATVGYLIADASVYYGKVGFDGKRKAKLEQWKPKRIFFTDYFTIWDREWLDSRISDTLSELVFHSPEKITIFGDIPALPMRGNTLKEFQKKLSAQKNLQFVTEMKPQFLDKQLKVENRLNKKINSDFRNENINFHTVWPMMISPKTENIQLVGYETLGKVLYKDDHHLNRDGANRMEAYIREHVFKGLVCE